MARLRNNFPRLTVMNFEQNGKMGDKFKAIRILFKKRKVEVIRNSPII